MSNKNYKPKNISVNQLISLFQTSPKEAYQRLINSRIHISYKEADKFWEAFRNLDLQAISNSFPDSYEVLNKTGKLHLFWDLMKLYMQHSKECEARILKLNPTPEALIKALFLALELGETHLSNENFPKYSYDSLEALKDILKKVSPQLKTENGTGYSLALFNDAKLLLRLTIDFNLLYEFIDAYEWADFDLAANEDGTGYTLSIPDNSPRENNQYILNILKTKVKRNYKRIESNEKVSNEGHFKEVDKVFKTHEGLATVFHSSGVESISQSPGMTSMQIDDEFFKKATSTDPKESGEAMIGMIHLMLTQSFHYNLRNALTNIYQPNDEVDVHSLHIKIDSNTYVSLYELFCVVSCMIGMADGFRYVGQIPYTGEIPFVKQNIIQNLKAKHPEKALDQLIAESDSIIVNHLPEIEKNNKPFYLLSKDAIIRYLRRIEELKSKSDNELEKLIDFVADIGNNIPFSPLYKTGNDYFFSYRTCYVEDLNRMMYDYIISEKLYNSHKKSREEIKEIMENQKSRELRFTNSIKELLSTITPYVAANLDYPDKKGKYDFGVLRGEFDAIAYFEDENILMPIQVKLSNTTPHSEKRKSEWVNNRIIGEVVDQIAKDVKLLQVKMGLEFIKEELNIITGKNLENAKIYPLIITDNFYVDHERFIYTDDGKLVICISYFELKHLLLNINIDNRQAKWDSFKENKSAQYLISLIEESVFWDFLNPLVGGVKTAKTLMVINKENRITLTV
ncbi:MAG: hypothetical protein ACXVNM_02960 [Bacteroidia bacterium]